MALLRALQICPRIPKRISQLKITREPWLYSEILRTQSLKYKKLKNNKKYIEALLKESKQNLPKHQKIELTQKALKLARKSSPRRVPYLQKRLYSLAPHLNPRPKRKDYLKVALGFRKSRQFDQATRYYQKTIRSALSVQEKIYAYKGLHKTFKIKREYEKSLKPLKDLHLFLSRLQKKRKFNNQQFINITNKYVRALWTYDHYSQAKNLLINLTSQKRRNRKVTLMESYWILGRMNEERGQFQKAINWFMKALKEKSYDSELKEKISWYLAWNLRKLKKYPESITVLKKLVQTASTPYIKNKFKYWLADSYLNSKNSPLFQKTLQELAQEDPLGYYGFLSQFKLGKKVSPLLSLKSETKTSKNNLKSYKFRQKYTEDLLVVGENRIAALYLSHFARKLPKYSENTEALWTDLFNYFARSGDYLKLFTTIGFWKPSRRSLFLKKFPEILFPKPFKDLVTSSAKKWKIDANYIYSIMRQESSFNPEARSPVDAFGLLQLLPKHARKHYQDVKVPYLTATDLFNPNINIPIGSYFLKGLWTKYEDRFILATAAYNSNDTAISGWLKTRYHGDSLTFIEDIPYEETRSYIKLVLRNYIVYSWLDNNQKPIPFPKHFLKI